MTSQDKSKIITIPDGKVCDYIDGTFRNDTPEEYVRQTIEKRLVNEHQYPQDRIKIEYILQVGSNKPRADIVIFKKDAAALNQESIYLIVECKKENINISDKKDGVGQLKSYMSACPNCEWGMWTNGKHKEVYKKHVNEKGEIEFLDYNDIPSADGNLEDIDRPKRANLKKSVDDNLLFAFKTCHDHIYVTDGLQKQPAFFELLKLIICKIEDEKNIPNPLEFYTSSKERSNPDGQLTVKKRISKIFDRVKKLDKYKFIFNAGDEIVLKPRSLAYIVAELQKYTFLDTHIDVKGKAYEEVVGANLRGDRGQFFTPRNMVKMAVEMIAPQNSDRILDPSCGTGGFLVVAMNKVIDSLKATMIKELGKPEKEWSYEEQHLIRTRISEIAGTNFFGFDIDIDLIKATKMNMVMNNDGSGNILREDSLLPPHEWSDEFRTNLAKSLGVEKETITKHDNIGFFDIVLSNPPFGSKIKIEDSHILEQFEIAYIWEKEGAGWKKSKRLQSSVAPEQLFIERCMQFLKPGGRMAIVLPDSILGSPGLGYLRHWLIKNAYIIASIDLHVDTFQPHNGTQTSILFLQKKTQEQIDQEEKSGLMKDYNIFMAMVDKVGHDKRGCVLFKRDKHGNEILTPQEDNILVMDQISGGEVTVKAQSKSKIVDDQTVLVPEIFTKWKKGEGLAW